MPVGATPARRLQRRIVAVLVIVAAGLRLAASWGDFWLDEIWSWQLALHAKSVWQIMVGLTHDNNHIFNTWMIFLLPPDADWRVYRIPAALAGVGTVAFAGLIGFRRSAIEGYTALTLTGASFILIQYSSESRGYAYLLFFLFLGIWLMDRMAANPDWREELLFSITASCGFLAHFSFLAAWCGFLGWSVVQAIRGRRAWRWQLLIWLRLHGLTAMTVGLVGIFWHGSTIVGAADEHRLLDVLVQAGSLSFGGPFIGPLATLTAVFAAAMICGGAWLAFRQGDGLFDFWGLTTIAFLFAMVITRPQFIYVRHFLILIAGGLMLSSHLLAWIALTGKRGRLAYAFILSPILLGNAIHIQGLLTAGRGGYQQAVAYIIQHSAADGATIGSDHDFRNTMMLNYYLIQLQNSKRIVYCSRIERPVGGLDWFIRHSFDIPAKPEPDFVDESGVHYRLIKVFPYYGLSGWNWMLYHRQSPASRVTDKGETDAFSAISNPARLKGPRRIV